MVSAARHITHVFEAGGIFSNTLAGYRPRAQQLEMALAVGKAIEQREVLIAEAGTGTGKTFAYLVPALLSQGKVLISTGTKALQEQLFSRDIPAVRKALKIPIKVALLKGRANYVCHYHLTQAETEGRFNSPQEIADLRVVRRFLQQDLTGDIGHLSEIPENASIWSKVTSTRDNCLGGECGFFKECCVMRARKEALAADIVVVNHSLFLADLMLKESGVSDLLPAVDTVIFDEAHQLPDAATQFMAQATSTHQLLDLARDTRVAGLAHARDVSDWINLTQHLEHAVRELRLTCANGVNKGAKGQDHATNSRLNYQECREKPEFNEHLKTLLDALIQLSKNLDLHSVRHSDLDVLARRCSEQKLCLESWCKQDLVENDDASNLKATIDTPEHKQNLTSETALHDKLNPEKNSTSHESAWVRWVEVNHTGIKLHSAPLSVAYAFSAYRLSSQAWILTSATLSVNQQFSYFAGRLGLEHATCTAWESPFNYSDQGLLYVPSDLPEPSSINFFDAFIKAIMPAIIASQGAAFILCTTLKAVDRIAESLAEGFKQHGLDWPLLAQGTAPRHTLLQKFRNEDHAVLIGSQSFWEGIDIVGERLTLVIIDKLPFAPPDDPLIDARIRALRSCGENPFMSFQVPEAAIALKQGAGRLIRSEQDWGVLMICDTRLVNKPYGRQLWKSLPAFKRTRELKEIEGFFREHKVKAALETNTD